MFKAAIIVCGGIGDVLYGLRAATILKNIPHKEESDVGIDIFVNSHSEITDFINTCTEFKAKQCPERDNLMPEPENPLNLPMEFIDQLYKDYNMVFACFPDGLGLNPFAFPWYAFCRTYKDFLRTRVKITIPTEVLNAESVSGRAVFIHANSVTPQKNWPLSELNKLIGMFNGTNFHPVVARLSRWKGEPIPFYCAGNFTDLCDKPIVNVLAHLLFAKHAICIDSGLAHCAYHLGVPRTVLQQHFQQPFHMVRWQEDTSDMIPLGATAEQIFNRVMLTIKEPMAYMIPPYLAIPANVNKKQLFAQKYYA